MHRRSFLQSLGVLPLFKFAGKPEPKLSVASPVATSGQWVFHIPCHRGRMEIGWHDPPSSAAEMTTNIVKMLNESPYVAILPQGCDIKFLEVK